MTEANPRRAQAVLRLLQLSSPSLPIGAYCYSQGFEQAVALSWVIDEASTLEWIQGILLNSLAYQDVPILKRLYQAWQNEAPEPIEYWNQFLFAIRETDELQQEDYIQGVALARLLFELNIPKAETWNLKDNTTLAVMYSLASLTWNISKEDMVLSYLWSWANNQIASAIKLIPLGQTSGQRLLSTLGTDIEEACHLGLSLSDDEIGNTAPGQILASCLHETQYCRLFRS